MNRSPQFMVTLFIFHVRPILEYCCSVWNLGYVTDSILLERVQRRWTKSIHGLSALSYHERLRSLDLFSLKGRRLRHDLIKYWRMFHVEESVQADLLTSFERAPRVVYQGAPI